MTRYLCCLLMSGLFAVAGCSSSHSGDDDDDDDDDTRCAMQKQCFPTDALGCCGVTPTSISICDACPSGTVERRECRTSGCEDPCAPDASGSSADEAPARDAGPGGAGQPAPALTCVEDLGGGCCGSRMFAGDMCGRCPTGTKLATECSAGFYPGCSCGSTAGDVPETPTPAPGEEPAGAPIPSAACYRFYGEGCCGEYVTQEGVCGCPPGTVPQSACGMTSPVPDADPALPVYRCRVDLGGGCCGDLVDRNLCTGACPAGTIAAETCLDVDEDSTGDAADPRPPSDGGAGVPAPPPADAGASDAGLIPPPPPPPPSMTCRVLDASGCCGAEVRLNTCSGECPAGAVYEWNCPTGC